MLLSVGLSPLEVQRICLTIRDIFNMMSKMLFLHILLVIRIFSEYFKLEILHIAILQMLISIFL